MLNAIVICCRVTRILVTLVFVYQMERIIVLLFYLFLSESTLSPTSAFACSVAGEIIHQTIFLTLIV